MCVRAEKRSCVSPVGPRSKKSFKPSTPWKPGTYGLRVGVIISDLAGNMIDRPFEIDRFDTVTERVGRETRLIPFTVR